MYNSIRMHSRERPLRPWVAINLNYEFVGKLQGQNNLKIPFITGFSTQPASSSHPLPRGGQGQRPSRGRELYYIPLTFHSILIVSSFLTSTTGASFISLAMIVIPRALERIEPLSRFKPFSQVII